MFNYGGLGGMASANMVSGVQQGYDWVGDQMDKSAKRKILQESWSIDKMAKLNSLQDNMMKTMNKANLMKSAYPGFSDQTVQGLWKQMQDTQKKLEQEDGDKIKNTIVSWLGAEDKDVATKQLNGMVRQRPDLAQKLGADPRVEFRTFEPTSENDVKVVQDYLSKTDPMWKQYNDQGKRDAAIRAMKTGAILNYGNKVVDMFSFAQATGALVSGDPDKVKRFEETLNRTLNEDETVVTTETEDKVATGTEQAQAKKSNLPRGVRNNNPGNIRYGEFAKRLGATGKDDKGFAIFPDYKSGEQAIAKLLDTRSYKNLTGKQAMMRYAPPSENNTSKYIAFMEKKGVPMNKKVSEMTPDEKQAMVDAIVHYENGMPTEKIASIVDDTSTVAGEAPQTQQEGYAQPQQDMQTTPFGNQLSGEDRYQLARQLAGLGDDRTSMEKNYQFLEEKLGKDLAQNYISQKAVFNAKPFQYQQLISDRLSQLENYVKGGELDPEMAQIMAKQYQDDIMDKERYGTSYTADQAKAKKAIQNSELWNVAKTNPVKVTKPVLNQMMLNEKMLKPLSPTIETSFESSARLAERANKIIHTIDKVGPGNFFRGGTEGIIQWAGTRAPDETAAAVTNLKTWIDKLSGSDRKLDPKEVAQKLENTVGLNSELGMLISDYMLCIL
jgi:hypothetical protein